MFLICWAVLKQIVGSRFLPIHQLETEAAEGQVQEVLFELQDCMGLGFRV